MLLVRCPRCHRDQKADPRPGAMSTKVKRCVFCGYSFKIHSNPEKSRIVKQLKSTTSPATSF